MNELQSRLLECWPSCYNLSEKEIKQAIHILGLKKMANSQVICLYDPQIKAYKQVVKTKSPLAIPCDWILGNISITPLVYPSDVKFFNEAIVQVCNILCRMTPEELVKYRFCILVRLKGADGKFHFTIITYKTLSLHYTNTRYFSFMTLTTFIDERRISPENPFYTLVNEENSTIYRSKGYRRLSKRLILILQLTDNGYAAKQIACQLGVTEGYINKIRFAMRKKIGVRSNEVLTLFHKSIGLISFLSHIISDSVLKGTCYATEALYSFQFEQFSLL